MSSTIYAANEQYNNTYDEVKKVRDVIKGSPFIKAAGTLYLPHPSSVDTSDTSRYKKYKNDAEFDEFTQNTERVMVGKMKLDDASFEPDARIDYLIEDVDKDGLSMRGLAESCARNVLEVKWHLLLADYKGLPTAPLEAVSVQDVLDANPRATIKQYSRENVLDWASNRIDGVMRFTYFLLTERGTVIDDDGNQKDVTTYLKLGIDETGYYQQKSTSESGQSFGEKTYISVGGQVLKFIPVSIVSDEEVSAGDIPEALGFLHPLADLALYRYSVSADFKEALTSLKPTMHVTGVTASGWEQFQEINGRDFIASGAFTPNIWPDKETQFNLVESNMSLEQYFRYFEENKDKVRALGGVFKTDTQTQRTATEVMTESETLTSALRPIADNIEAALKWQVAYCAMFEGVVPADSLADYVAGVDLYLNKEFAVNKLTVEEVKALLDVYMSGLLPKDEFLKLMELGGWTQSTAEDLINKMDGLDI